MPSKTLGRLPAALTSFVGRAAESATVDELAARDRLVTLTGAGGCGKTRLALHVATQREQEYADGVWWVELARLGEGTLLPNAVASTLGVKEVSGQQLADTIEKNLRDKNALLVLDNCEHIVAACAALVHRLLVACPGLKVLATSREPLGVDGEVSWRVPSMRLPEGDNARSIDAVGRSEAVQLFVERAGRVRPGVYLTEHNAPVISEICERLDGIPLAIELAAARARMMSPEQILEGLGDRFRLLVGSSRTALPRHQTLRASVAWSYELLTDEEQRALGRLSVFAGGFTLDAAEQVCAGDGISRGDVLDALTGLVDRSLVQVDDRADARYRLLEMIKQFAAERLAESDEEAAVRDRHLRYFIDLAERADAAMSADGLLKWLPILDAEHDNLRAAFDWSVRSGATDDSLVLLSHLWQFWMVRGHLTEGRRLFEVALSAERTAPKHRAAALIGAAQLELYHGDVAATQRFSHEAFEIGRSVGDAGLQGRALENLAWSSAFLDPPAAPALFDEARTFLEQAHDRLFLADSFNGLGTARYFAGDYVGARAAFEEAVARSRALGHQNMLTIGLGILGYTLGLQGRLARARTCLRESLALARQLEDRVFTAQSLYSLGFVESHHGDHGKAQAALAESIAIARDLSPMMLTFGLLTQGIALYARGEVDGTVAPLEEALALAEDLPIHWLRAWALALLGNIARVQDDLDSARDLVEQAVSTARAGGVRVEGPIDAEARLARATGDPERAESLHHDALAAALQAESVLLVPMHLEAIAGLAAEFESYAEAARLLGAADAARDAHGLARYAIDQAAYDADVTCVRRSLSDAEFNAAWEQGRGMSLDDAIAYASRGRGERKRPSAGWASLTPTELEVVRQVAEGLKNAQIAEKLFISTSTVKVHLSHIFAKLGITTRAELAAQATRRAL